MAYIGTFCFFGIACKSSKTEWKQKFGIDNCGHWFVTIYKDHKGLYCGKSKSKKFYDKCDEIYDRWETTYYNSKKEYCGKSVSKMTKYTIEYQIWHTAYYDANGILSGTSKSINVINHAVLGHCPGWNTDYYDVNDNKCGKSISEPDFFGGPRFSKLTDSWKTEYYGVAHDKRTGSEGTGCGFLNWLKFW